MRYLQIIGFLGFVFLGSYSCRNKSCPDFDVKLLEWLPYTVNDTLIFTDSLNNEYIFHVKGARINHQTSYNEGNDCIECVDTWSLTLKDSTDDMMIILNFAKNELGHVAEQDEIYKGKKMFYVPDGGKTFEYKDSMVIKNHIFYNIKIASDKANKYAIITSRKYGIIMIKVDDLTIYNLYSKSIDNILLESYHYSETKCI
jgi:hypothetical protein